MNDRILKFVFLFADVGGGHRAPAEAVREALRRDMGDRVEVKLVDMLADYAPFPYNRGRQMYTQTARFARPFLWMFFHALDGPTRIRLAVSVMWRPMRRAMREMLADHPADLYVSFHPTYSFPLTWLRVPSVVVFTDLVTNHALWCARGAERYLVPTNVARERAIKRRVPSDRIEVSGLPVHPRFTDPSPPREELRLRLGIKSEKPIILLSGGGEGMGRVFDIAHAIGESTLDAQLVVTAGRNYLLHQELQLVDWPMPTHVLGFTHEMSDWMAVSSVLIGKSGSNTIAEALVRGLPTILFDFVPGQEEGNPKYLIDADAGAYCPRPAEVIATLREWLGNRSRLSELAANAHALSRPDAAFEAARIIRQIAEERIHAQN